MPNQTVNKVEFGGQTVMDITDTTADAADVIEGEVFYTKSGARSIGTLGDATTTTHGLMSVSDKIKLNGLDNNVEISNGWTGSVWQFVDNPYASNRTIRSHEGSKNLFKDSDGNEYYSMGITQTSVTFYPNSDNSDSLKVYDNGSWTDNKYKTITFISLPEEGNPLEEFKTQATRISLFTSQDLNKLYIDLTSNSIYVYTGTSTFTPILNLATVATTGSYTDLIDKPLPVPTLQDSGKIVMVSSKQYILVDDWGAFTGATSTSNGQTGLVPQPLSHQYNKFLCGDGYWSDIPTMVGATSSANGTAGTVPAPTTADVNKFLCGNGTWATPLTGITLVSTSLTPSNGVVTIPAMTGATSSAAGTAGLVPAPASADREKFFRGDGTWQDGGKPMVILSYGNSTWAEFEAAYNNNVIVYCRASSNSNPATGSQTRMAFMAYVNNATTPTNVEFQYYRSVNVHSATQMGDQVFIYKLDKTSGWSVTTREASIKEINVASGSKLGVSWSSNKVTLSNTMTASDLPMSSNDSTIIKDDLTGIAAVFTGTQNTSGHALEAGDYFIYGGRKYKAAQTIDIDQYWTGKSGVISGYDLINEINRKFIKYSSVDNVDTCTSTGYELTGSSANTPGSIRAGLLRIYASGDRIIQIFNPRESNLQYTRWSDDSGSTWTNWIS